MKKYKADFHVHSVLSPCASLDMSPKRIISRAKEEGIDVVAITDHNTTRHCRIISKLGEKEKIKVIPGVEINSKEEIHCLAFFETVEKTDIFQEFLEQWLPEIKNKKSLFGYQLVVDEDENILDEVEWLLISALNATINQIEKQVHKLGGLFVPAHIDRKSNSILSNLGFIPDDLDIDALELSPAGKETFYSNTNFSMVRGSDAHIPEDIGKGFTELFMNDLSFGEIRKTFRREGGRETKLMVRE
jgi:3',5'-nucleoside bisphosphate phosphatase